MAEYPQFFYNCLTYSVKPTDLPCSHSEKEQDPLCDKCARRISPIEEAINDLKIYLDSWANQ